MRPGISSQAHTSREQRLSSGVSRLLGCMCAVLVLMLGAPLHALIWACIYATDRGPCFYRARRLGRGGQAFSMVKYRTMTVGASPLVSSDLKVVTQPDDIRITKVGRWLRCGIDELPQAWNILKGEMAWIGPRPVEPWGLPHYGPVLRERLLQRPGVTGLAQVLGCRWISSAEGYAIDIWHGRHRGVWLAAWIVAATPLFVLGWTTIGRRRLERLRKDPEFQQIKRQCEAEFESAWLHGRQSSLPTVATN